MKQGGQLIFSISSLYRLTSQSALSRWIGVNFLPYFQCSKTIPPFSVFNSPPPPLYKTMPIYLYAFESILSKYTCFKFNWKLFSGFCEENDKRRRQQQKLQTPEKCNIHR